MQTFGQYILSIGMASLIVAIIEEFSDHKNATGTAIRMVCGLFLAFTVINPVTKLNIGILDAFSENLQLNAEAAVSAGSKLADQSLRQIIKEETQAYILDKAKALGCTLEADVTVGEGKPPVPASVRITGRIPANLKADMEVFLDEELGISKENQQWIG